MSDKNRRFTDEPDADLEMATTIVVNAKVQRPSVCNAMETLLVHRDVAPRFLPAAAARLVRAGVELRGCPQTLALVPGIRAASERSTRSGPRTRRATTATIAAARMNRQATRLSGSMPFTPYGPAM